MAQYKVSSSWQEGHWAQVLAGGSRVLKGSSFNELETMVSLGSCHIALSEPKAQLYTLRKVITAY